MNKFCYIILFLTLMSCQKEKKQLAFYDSSPLTEDEDSLCIDYGTYSYGRSGDVVSIPFQERGGVKYLNVTINSTIGVDMILDSGCSGALISADEANYLYSKGVLSEDDIRGVSKSQIADGSIVENMVVNLREVVIGGKIRCSDVEATVSSNSKAPLLLGNEILNRTASYTVDNQRKVINFTLN